MTGCVGRTVSDVALEDGCTVTANCVAAGGCELPTVKLLDVAAVRPYMPNMSVYVPDPVIARFVNVATPLTAFTTVVPESVPGPLAIVAATEPDVFTRLLFASRSCTTGCVASAAPDAPPTGCTDTASCVAVGLVEPAVVMLMVFEVAAARLFVVKRSVNVPAPVMARFVNVATPFTALTTVVPDSVPEPLAMLAVTDAELLTRLLLASRTCTTGCVPSVLPDVPPTGCTLTASCVGVAARTVMLALPLAPLAVA